MWTFDELMSAVVDFQSRYYLNADGYYEAKVHDIEESQIYLGDHGAEELPDNKGLFPQKSMSSTSVDEERKSARETQKILTEVKGPRVSSNRQMAPIKAV